MFENENDTEPPTAKWRPVAKRRERGRQLFLVTTDVIRVEMP